jgi:very-short-patch-repair endonuclease
MLRTTPYSLPYNPKLRERARELRKHQTPAEKKLWYEYLRQLPVMVHRQKVIHHFIVDFYIAPAKLVIELDGENHATEDGAAYDQERTEILSGYGLTVLRFWNDEVQQDFENICGRIAAAIETTSDKCK